MNPYWTHPAVREGRITPDNSIAPGPAGSAYYQAYYTSYYGTLDGKVFCLGADHTKFPARRALLGDTISVQQDFDVPAAQRLLRFAWHMRSPQMPAAAELATAAEVSFVNGAGLVVSSPVPDGCIGAQVHTGLLRTFTSADVERRITFSGAADPNNNATFVIGGVPQDQAGDSGGDRILLRNPLSKHPMGHPSYPAYPAHPLVPCANDTGVAIRIHGLKWHGTAYIREGAGPWVSRVELQERTGHTAYRADLALNVSQYAGTMGAKFELELQDAG